MTDAQPPRSVGRRAWDKGKSASLAVLVIGALFQGGFLLVVREMLQKDERQQNAERAERARQQDDMMLLYETTSEQLGAILNVERVQAGEKARVDPLTFKARREERAKKKAAKAAAGAADTGGVTLPESKSP